MIFLAVVQEEGLYLAINAKSIQDYVCNKAVVFGKTGNFALTYTLSVMLFQ